MIKKWFSIFAVIFISMCVVWIGGNYFFDPTNYFLTKKKHGEYISQNYHTKMAKAYYMGENGNDYDGVIIGGSKSGMLHPDELTKYTGKRYYHMYASSLTYMDAYYDVKFLLENTDVSYVVLCPSSYDVLTIDPGDKDDSCKIPAILTGESEQLETVKQLFTNISTWYTKIRTLGKDTMCLPDGTWDTGEQYEEYINNPDAYVLENVVEDMGENLEKLFTDEYIPNLKAHEYNVDTLKEIKKLCDERGVELTVIITPTYIESRYMFECEEYYDYMKELVMVTDIWDFSGYNAVNLNPYNLIDDSHYFRETGDAILSVVFGGNEIDDFGVLLTKDNIDDYIKERRKGYEKLKLEWEKTKNVQLEGRYDNSNFMKK